MKRIMCAAMAAGLVVVPVLAGGAAHAQDFTEGWINLFDGETLFGLQPLGDTTWEAGGGALSCTGGIGGWIATTGQWGDFELTLKVRVAAKQTTAVVVRAPLSGHFSENGSVVIPIVGPESGNDWQEVAITAEGNTVSAKVNGQDVAVAAPGNAVGHIGILYQGAQVEASAIKLRPLAMAAIFNGTDLTGWNIIPERKSVFTVEDGAIRIKNGNGQIETDGLYQNFVLQLEIFSNGDHLNSGVFFRGPKGVFWKGYESQVRNEWKDDDRSAPVDFGTGGLYGIQPARKVVSSDREWFYKTVLCNGNHFAVWINGYAVSDFLDMRAPVDDSNAKAGFVGAAGTIHLQGHDPTTDLSFKNIRLQAYPSGE
ncbi:MAG TPA: DUF1080 domain-containing protein [Candidatus Hydrogenedentes bacterium]|jgi:hypothetical protein|nr:DUF1080 domain-containing protein [Candidatus Hydrogenedentota bacterium]MDY0030558.1 DUF1080 domain-containing protein [FCB group bacterium]NLT62760.1 DUF1080 domain-containing protein [Candidatus Hydrogenedentota bacterium]HNZ16782.1 DUF1080 domain-containing protein [Candidatus Hydrogenedentota bacterium]HOH32609.1 DUF1080 domain-containing protein [Candidatus Hydrogenedentota bacterium]